MGQKKIKPVITVSCLPGDLTEEVLVQIHQALVGAMEKTYKFGIHGEESTVHLFVPDMMKYGLGTEIVIEGKWFPEPEYEVITDSDWNWLARSLGVAVQSILQHTFIQCVVKGFGVERGFWTSPVLPPEKKS